MKTNQTIFIKKNICNVPTCTRLITINTSHGDRKQRIFKRDANRGTYFVVNMMIVVNWGYGGANNVGI